MKRILIITSMLAMTACTGTNSLVSGVTLTTSTANNTLSGSASVTINNAALAGATLPNISVPIIDSANSTATMGSVSLANNLSTGATQLTLTLNLSSIYQFPQVGTAATLPNGQAIPVAGLDSDLQAFSVGGTTAVVYVDLNVQTKNGTIGIAVPIQQLSTVGTTIGTSTIFPTFSVNGINGTGGLFTGTGAGQSGFALFISANAFASALSAIVPLVNTTTTAAVAKSSAHQYLQVLQASEQQQKIVQQKLLEISQSKSRLSLIRR